MLSFIHNYLCTAINQHWDSELIYKSYSTYTVWLSQKEGSYVGQQVVHKTISNALYFSKVPFKILFQ